MALNFVEILARLYSILFIYLTIPSLEKKKYIPKRDFAVISTIPASVSVCI